MFRIKNFFLLGLIVLMILVVSCKKKDDDNSGVTNPKPQNSKDLLVSKTFVWKDKEIIFNADSFPETLIADDGEHDDTANNTTVNVKTIIYSSSETRIIYEQKAIVTDKGTSVSVEVNVYTGYAIKDNGNLLYKIEKQEDTADKLVWKNATLSGVVKSKRLLLDGNWSEVAKSKGSFSSPDPYVNSDDEKEYYGIKIGEGVGEIYLATADVEANVIDTLNVDTTYGDIGNKTENTYSLRDVVKSYIYKGPNNHFIVMLYIDSKSTDEDATSDYIVLDFNANSDIVLFFDNTITNSIVLKKNIP